MPSRDAGVKLAAPGRPSIVRISELPILSGPGCQEVPGCRRLYGLGFGLGTSRGLKKPVTIRLDEATITYFKDLADETGIPYQTLINLYLRDCAATVRSARAP